MAKYLQVDFRKISQFAFLPVGTFDLTLDSIEYYHVFHSFLIAQGVGEGEKLYNYYSNGRFLDSQGASTV